MWARRCGAPPRSPSRVKVFFLSLTAGTVGLAMYQYMSGSDVGYLDLSHPIEQNVICLTHWPERAEIDVTHLHADFFSRWYERVNDMDGFIQDHECVTDVTDQSCATIRVPMQDLDRKLLTPMSRNNDSGILHDVLDLYASVFLWLTLVLWLAVFCHDCALINSRYKDSILDWTGLNRGFPLLRQAFALTCFWRVKACVTARGGMKVAGIVTLVLLAPLLLAWAIFVFVAVIVPLVIMLFFCHPVRMSRFMIFIVTLGLAIYGVALVINMLAFIANKERRPSFAITFESQVVGSQDTCVCGCSFPVKDVACLRILLIGALATTQALFMSFLCLKGLRRSQWASLMSIKFHVPITVYNVEWDDGAGNPIRHRTTKMPEVQAELAFDPFCLMDEQPCSNITTVTLQPEEQYELVDGTEWQPRILGRTTHGPEVPVHIRDVTVPQPTEFIGCCGFPCLTGGYRGTFVISESDEGSEYGESDDDERFELMGGDDSVGLTHGDDSARELASGDKVEIAITVIPPSEPAAARSRATSDGPTTARSPKHVGFDEGSASDQNGLPAPQRHDRRMNTKKSNKSQKTHMSGRSGKSGIKKCTVQQGALGIRPRFATEDNGATAGRTASMASSHPRGGIKKSGHATHGRERTRTEQQGASQPTGAMHRPPGHHRQRSFSEPVNPSDVHPQIVGHGALSHDGPDPMKSLPRERPGAEAGFRVDGVAQTTIAI